MYAYKTYNSVERKRGMPRANLKEERIHLRLSTATKKKIERAAEIAGSTVTDFVIAAISKKADQVIEEQERLILSDRNRDVFLEAITGSPPPNKKLKETFRNYKKLETIS